MVIRTKLIFITALALLLAACGGTADTTPDTTPETPALQKQVEIEDLGWVIKNDDPSQDANGVSAFLWASINFADTGLEATDFASVRITSPTGRTWADEASEFVEWYDSEENWYPMGNMYSTSLDSGASVELGNYTVEVTLKNGNKAKKTLFVPAPGSRTTEGYEFAYTEDYSGAGNPPSNYVALPKRATVTNATLDAQASTLEVNFSVEDETVYDGWLRVYDEAGDHIGSSNFFRDYETGKLMEQLNGGETLSTDGGANTLSLAASSEELSFFGTATFVDIASVSVILTDGKQYADTEGRYHTRSRTAKFNVAVIE